MSRAGRLIIVATATLLIGLITLFPARIAYNWLAPTGLRLSGISGTIWRGAAVEGQAARLYVRNLTWDFKPLYLFTGNLAIATAVEVAGGSVDTDVIVGFGGTVAFSGLSGNAPIVGLSNFIQIPNLPFVGSNNANQVGVNGNINAVFSTLKIDDGIPVIAEGVVNISNLFVRQLAPTNVGDFKVEFNTTDEGIVASVQDTAGFLDLAGTFRITSDRLYSFTGLVAPTPTTPSTVVEQLSFLGSANDRGQREFRFEGEL
jgi:general secretion pathway protein N